MTPLLTINLLRTLFVVFTALVGNMIGESFVRTSWAGSAAGIAFGLAVVLVDRLMHGCSSLQKSSDAPPKTRNGSSASSPTPRSDTSA
jgi:hypothetical protein